MFAQLSIAQREYDLDREQYLQTFKPLRDQAVEISDISRAAYNEGGLDLVRLLDAERVRVEAEVSGGKIKFFIEPGVIGNVHLAVDARLLAIGIRPEHVHTPEAASAS